MRQTVTILQIGAGSLCETARRRAEIASQMRIR
jgi:hypothetical protein